MVTFVSAKCSHTNGQIVGKLIQILSCILPAIWACLDGLVQLSQFLNILDSVYVLSMFDVVVTLLVQTQIDGKLFEVQQGVDFIVVKSDGLVKF